MVTRKTFKFCAWNEHDLCQLMWGDRFGSTACKRYGVVSQTSPPPLGVSLTRFVYFWFCWIETWDQCCVVHTYNWCRYRFTIFADIQFIQALVPLKPNKQSFSMLINEEALTHWKTRTDSSLVLPLLKQLGSSNLASMFEARWVEK